MGELIYWPATWFSLSHTVHHLVLLAWIAVASGIVIGLAITKPRKR